MDKLVIRSKKKYGDSSVVSARLPNEIVATLDETARKSGRTRNEIVLLCLEYALQQIQIEPEEGAGR
ncbi:MAG: ribbon-helix-helix protein, CopG family [Anaerofustis sp.]